VSADLTFYTHPMTRGRAVRWMLEEVGTPYKTVPLDFATTMKAHDYLTVNPMGKVPAIRHDGTVVTEAAAICAYLADAFPDAGLAPPPAMRGDYYRWLFFGAGPLDQAVTMNALGMDIPAKGMGTLGTRALPTVLDVLESAVSQHAYLAGNAFSAADVYVGFNIGFGLRFGTIEPRQVLQAYWNRISARPAYERASSIDDALLASEA
jgi:glutathione S-transferase